MPRLYRIHVNGTPNGLASGSPPDALLQFSYVSGGGPNLGKLERINVFRFNGTQQVLTQWVKYTYYDANVHHLDVGTEGDLVQVVTAERVDPLPGTTAAAWRKRITQYRYHRDDAQGSGGVTDRYNWDGDDHQLKLVIEPEQFEYLAQKLAVAGTSQPYQVEHFAATVLNMADGDAVALTQNESVPLVDFAAVVNAKYETSGQGRLLEQYVLSDDGCGSCGTAGTQGAQLRYTYYDRDADPSVAETVKIAEHLHIANGPGYEQSPYRTTYVEIYRPVGAGGIPYVRSRAVEAQANPNVFWVTYFEHDSAKRNLIAEYTPAAVASYTPGGAQAPTYTFDPNGLVHVYEYTSDNRIAKRQLSQGPPTFQSGSCTDCVLIEQTIYGDGSGHTRKHLPEENRRYRKDPNQNGFDPDDDVQVVRFTYGFHAGSGDDVAWMKTEVEAELESENGPGSTSWYASYELYDQRGDNIWSVAADGAITERSFDTANSGKVLTVTRNAPNNIPANFEGLSTTGFGRVNDGGSLTTEYVRDLLGRVRESVTPGLVSTYTVRHMFMHGDRPGLTYYCELTLPHIINAAMRQYNGPAKITWFNASGRAFASSEFEIGTNGYTFGPPNQGGYPLLISSYTLAQEISRRIVRHDISGLEKVSAQWNGLTDGPDFDNDVDGPNKGVHVTLYGHDQVGRLRYTVNPNGSATRYSYDVLDRVTKVEVGIARSPTWVPADADMRTTLKYYYDSNGQPSQGIGNGNVTLIEEFTDNTNHRDTEMAYDWRDRRIKAVNPLPPHSWTEYDNLDRVIQQAVFTAEPSAIDNPLNSGNNFRGQYTEISYSQRGLVYRQAVATNPRSATPTFLETHTWFDEIGRSVATWGPNGPAQKTSYDGLGRPSVVYVTDRRDDALPGTSGNFDDVYSLSMHAAKVDGDVVLEQTNYRYILDEGLIDLVTSRRRTHDAAITDTGALDGGGFPTNKVITTYSGTWYDEADRVIRQAQYGTNTSGFQSGGSAPTINQQSPPDANPSDATKLVTETTYNPRGLVDTTTDGAGQVTRFFYDAMDRRIVVVENYDSTNPVIFHWESPLQAPGSSGPPILRWVIDDGLDASNPDRNRVTGFVYDGLNNTIRQAAYVFNDAGNVVMQETAYIYEVTPITGGSTIYSNDLLSEVIYPDSSTGGGAGIPGGGITEPQPIRFFYNHQGELIVLRDENDTKHEYTRDALGRVTLDKATVATNISAFQVDGTINAITTAFDTLGRVDVTRSYTNYGAGGQAVKNAVQLTYNDLWQVADVKQQPDGDINANSKSVTYTYDTEPVASGNYSRQRILGYPDGWTLTYDFGTSGSTNDLITRPLKLLGPGLPTADTYAKYDYVGLSTVAIVDYGKPDVQLSRFVAHNGERTPGSYPGLDRFGRVIRHLWADGDFDEHATLPGGAVPNIPPIVEIAYTYDNASNRTGAFDARPGAQQPLSHQYAYDGLHRLKEAKRGVWNHDLQTPSVTHGLKSQNWSLDPLGNWLSTNIETNGTSGFQGDEEETRDHDDATLAPPQNKVNQLFKRHDPAWSTGDGLDLAYDFAGNLRLQELTDDGEFGAVGINSLVYTHDAWDRLVKVQYKDASGTLHPRAEYQYNGLNWRTIKRADTNLTDGTHALTQQRLMYYSAAWQLLEERIDDNWTQQSSTVDRHVQHVWGVRYIDDIIAHRQDDDPAQADGYEKVWFHLTDAQFSTVAIIDANANVAERVTYTAYGRARHHWFEDVDGDGDHDTADLDLVRTLNGKRIQDVGYRAEADLDRDGDIDRTDYGLANSSDPFGTGFGHAALAEGVLSSPTVDNVIGWDGYVFNAEVETYTVRFRTYGVVLGRWLERDPAEYIEGANLYGYGRLSPLANIDPLGLQSWGPPQRHHPIPIRLGGCPTQPMFELPSGVGSPHQEITNWWDKHFPKGGEGLRKWNNCSSARQRWIVRGTLKRFADVSDDVLESCMDDVFKGLRTVPQRRGYGKVIWRHGTGRVLGAALGVVGVLDMFASNCYAPTIPWDWRQTPNDPRKCKCECTTELEQWIVPCWWAFLDEEERSRIPCANEPWIGFDKMTAGECAALEGPIEAREVGSARGFRIYEVETVVCRWAGNRYGFPGAPVEW